MTALNVDQDQLFQTQDKQEMKTSQMPKNKYNFTPLFSSLITESVAKQGLEGKMKEA